MPDEGADDREAGRLDDGLHGVGDVADVVADARLLDPGVARLLADVEQPPRLVGDLTHGERVGAVGDQAVECDADVDRDQVAVVDAVVARDPVDDHRVRGDARGRREAPVTLRGRHAAVLADERVRDQVELARRDPGLKLLAEERDRLGDELAGTCDSLDLLR